MHKTSFIIENHSSEKLNLYVEPENFVVTLSYREGVNVIDEYDKAPVTIMASLDEKGQFELSLWPGDGDMRVLRNGDEVF